MKKIFKYPLTSAHNQFIELPLGAEILTVAFQQGLLNLWALVDPTMPTGERQFEIRATGEEFEDKSCQYIGTVQSASGMFVWHVFERYL
jgi:hypothetical protein